MARGFGAAAVPRGFARPCLMPAAAPQPSASPYAALRKGDAPAASRPAQCCAERAPLPKALAEQLELKAAWRSCRQKREELKQVPFICFYSLKAASQLQQLVVMDSLSQSKTPHR